MGGYPLFNGNYNETSVFNYAWTWTWVQVGFQWVVGGGWQLGRWGAWLAGHALALTT